MKKAFLLLMALAALAPCYAQHVIEDDMQHLHLRYATPPLEPDLILAGYQPAGELGAPALPTLSHLIEIPLCEAIEVEVLRAVYDTLPLPFSPAPRQPSPSKRSGREQPFFFNDSLYAASGWHGNALASVQAEGVMRDRRIATLTFSPVRVNIQEGLISICRQADIIVRYHQADTLRTLQTYRRHYAPAFRPVPTLNNLYASAAPLLFEGPIHMAIVVPQSLRCYALQRFADWKRQQGLLVSLIEVPNHNEPAATANALRELYDGATDTLPAPTYLLLVGDHDQLPAFPSDLPTDNLMHSRDYQLDEHITDLYFSTWTADRLPDAYTGRLSATDTATLAAIIDKTLYYEQYRFADDTYLGRAALVAGVDNIYYRDTTDYGYACADPTVDYLAYQYVNISRGYSDVKVYKNNYAYAPYGIQVSGNSFEGSTATLLRKAYGEGLGWVNYSAHGDWDGWVKPQFTYNQALQLKNSGKPSIMIGNCCLSNAFEHPTCFGEALLRCTGRGGAAAYIGATNSTFWYEDFYWSVGVRKDVYNRMLPDYDTSRRGAYDLLYHTHGEGLLNCIATVGQMLMQGNMSVYSLGAADRWSRSVRDYYLEIYSLMGDPSLLPWLGTAEPLTTSMSRRGDFLTFSAPAGAHVAILRSDSLTLVQSRYAWPDGLAYFTLNEADLEGCLVSITAQGYQPLLQPIVSVPVGLGETEHNPTLVYPNPTTDQLTVQSASLRSITLFTLEGRPLCCWQAAADCTTLSLAAYPAATYLLRVETATTTTLHRISIIH